jgi:hypothetical protein
MTKEEQLKQLIKDHLEAYEEECRWCFAIDLHRAKAKLIDQYNFPDATIIHMKCDRCGGEYSYYFTVWGEDYTKQRIARLYPELEGEISDDMIVETNSRLWPECHGDC